MHAGKHAGMHAGNRADALAALRGAAPVTLDFRWCRYAQPPRRRRGIAAAGGWASRLQAVIPSGWRTRSVPRFATWTQTAEGVSASDAEALHGTRGCGAGQGPRGGTERYRDPSQARRPPARARRSGGGAGGLRRGRRGVSAVCRRVCEPRPGLLSPGEMVAGAPASMRRSAAFVRTAGRQTTAGVDRSAAQRPQSPVECTALLGIFFPGGLIRLEISHCSAVQRHQPCLWAKPSGFAVVNK
jgi:hypothetical protein